MSTLSWKSLHPKGMKNRPGINQVLGYLPEDIGALFQEFSRHLAREYGANCLPPKFTEADGWVFPFGRYSVCIVNRVSIKQGAFAVQGHMVSDEKSLKEIMEMVDALHDDFKKRLDIHVAKTLERQKVNTQKRKEREKKELEILSQKIDKDKFNKFRWSPKVSRNDIVRLYKNDAIGIQDEEFADKIGCALYARCLQGRDEGRLKDRGQLKCHNCGEVLKARGQALLMECSCGHQYIFRDYMRAFRMNNMPSGAATAIFNAFIDNWERAKGYAAKMLLIDNLIHEFHINLNSGVKGRFVGINLIEGNKKQIADLILGLAYGDTVSKEKFIANLNKQG